MGCSRGEGGGRVRLPRFPAAAGRRGQWEHVAHAGGARGPAHWRRPAARALHAVRRPLELLHLCALQLLGLGTSTEHTTQAMIDAD